ncbi:Arm DNA-binding domain-containing protein [Blautia obeum]|uniref:Arm DNA-binding domain-containing protein n=1 Tax=Blautia obeum TaxID=40520 RepID=UPI001D08EDC3|nr:Arm DNA-binding domain-containing protein [Blautia obeum]MCB6334244.1 Arm DNA-binding domain-containing protein [Blautia obeum]MCQ5358633.1 Arm DNA-binding domain-containing protein [Blautia obeum]
MAYREKDTKKWTAQWFETNVMGEKKKRRKRGFETKREALEFERSKKLSNERSMDMKLSDFIEIYFSDKQNDLKDRTIKNKRYMMQQHIVPYFGNQMMSEIKASQIIQWQNEIQKKGYSDSYLRMIQNQLTSLFTHAAKIYDLPVNPCKKVKRMGNSDSRSLNFWTLDEYKQFIQTMEPGTRYYLMFEMLFWTGCRIGDDDDKIRLNQRKPSKYKGLSRFGPEKNLQRINKFMKERPTFYKKLIQMKENFRFYLRCFYCITKVVILQFNSEKQDRISS